MQATQTNTFHLPIANPGNALQANSYQPSVPISVYRQLVAELQSTKERMTALELENQKLASQNQVFLQEFAAIANSNQQIQTIVLRSSNDVRELAQQSTQRLQQVLTPTVKEQLASPSFLSSGQPSAQHPIQNLQQQIGKAIAKNKQSPIQTATTLPTFAPISTQPETTSQMQTPPTSAVAMPLISTESMPEIISEPGTETSSLSGWWLTLTVVSIVLVSFGAGYLLMKPFANSK
jgi:hypothetical protein